MLLPARILAAAGASLLAVFGSLVPAPLLARSAARVWAGTSHLLVLTTDGTLLGKGDNQFGQLGRAGGGFVGDYIPIAQDAISASGGMGYTMFVKRDGSLWALGWNEYGNLGDGSTTDRTIPIQVATDVAAVGTGGLHTTFIKTDGTVWSMGDNGSGRLGDGTTTNRLTPVQVFRDAASLAVGVMVVAVVKPDGTCWTAGDNHYGALADGSAITYRPRFEQVATGVGHVAAGRGHLLLLHRDGTLSASGANEFGQLGDGTTTSRSRPVPVASDVVAVAATDDTTLFVKADRTLWGMGENLSGQLGDGTTENRAAPVLIASDVASAAAAATSITFTKTDGSLWAIGANAAGAWTESHRPVKLWGGGSPVSRLCNISARGSVGTGNGVMIGGFVVNGGVSTEVLMRAVGPTLTTQGIAPAQVLNRPVVELHHGSTLLATRRTWAAMPDAEDIVQAGRRTGATPFAPDDRTSAAMLTAVPRGIYTFIAKGEDDTTGVALLEVYKADATGGGGNLVNIACRMHAGQDNDVAIGGFVINGDTPKQVLVRAVGPTLATQGLQPDEVLADPTIELHDASHGNVVVARSDDWRNEPDVGAIVSAGARVGATPCSDTDTTSAALLVTLNPGAYTFIAQGKDHATGIVLVEVYDAD